MLRHKDILSAVNALTRSWLGEIPSDAPSVLSGIGVWPLLALLAEAADGPGRRRLADAIGIPAEEAASAVPVVLAALRDVPAVTTALAFWHARGLPIELTWRALLPADVSEELSGDAAADQAAVDRWAAERTEGLIQALPVRVNPSTEFLLASAVLVRTRWMRPFADDFYFQPESGPWRDRTLFALTRRTHNLDRVRVTGTDLGHITSLELPGSGGVDVHLVMGLESGSAAEIMQAAAGCIRSSTAVRGAQLPLGAPVPGLTVDLVPSEDGEDILSVCVPRFSISAEHDLLRHPGVFGLDEVTDASRGCLPGISSKPLAVEAAAQSATATFSATGFEAAAVTAVGAFAGGLYRPARRAKCVTVRFDRPFGFFAVDRRTGLILVAGWVTEPEGWDPRQAFEDIVDIGDLFPELPGQ